MRGTGLLIDVAKGPPIGESAVVLLARWQRADPGVVLTGIDGMEAQRPGPRRPRHGEPRREIDQVIVQLSANTCQASQ